MCVNSSLTLEEQEEPVLSEHHLTKCSLQQQMRVLKKRPSHNSRIVKTGECVGVCQLDSCRYSLIDVC